MSETNTSQTSRRNYIKAVAGASSAGLAGCSDVLTDNSESIQAAFVFDGRVGDAGWTRSNDDARQNAEEEIDDLETSSVENVAAGDAEGVISGFADDGFDIIFTTSVTFQDATLQVAQDYPDTIFCNANGFNTAENLSRYTYRLYEGSFCAGMLAGMKTETNRIGYIGGFAVPVVLRHLNAWAWGAHYTNPDAMLEARYLGTFFDPEGASSMVDTLVDEDVDAITGTMDSTATQEACADNEVWNAGWATDMSDAGGEYYLVGAMTEWSPFFIQEIRKVMNDEWESGEYWLGFDSGVIKFDEFGPQITDEEQSEAVEMRDSISNGEYNAWEGTQFEDLSLEPGSPLETEMNEYVENVAGEVPE